MRTLIIQERSRTLGVEQLSKIQAQLERGENVVLLSNHQTEADPQVAHCCIC
jgi:glycerol-3-phosphate O-acyltransferase